MCVSSLSCIYLLEYQISWHARQECDQQKFEVCDKTNIVTICYHSIESVTLCVCVSCDTYIHQRIHSGRRSKLCANILHIKIKHNQTFECQSSQQLKIEFKLFKIFFAASCWLLAFVCVISIDIVLWNTEPDTMNRSLYETLIRDGSELSKNTWLANLQFHDERRVVYDVMLLCSLLLYTHIGIYMLGIQKRTLSWLVNVVGCLSPCLKLKVYIILIEITAECRSQFCTKFLWARRCVPFIW